MKPVRLNLVSNTAQAFIEYNAVRNADDGIATHVLLPIEGDSEGDRGMTRRTLVEKIDRIWDLVIEMNEDEGAMTGKIEYSNHAIGRLTITIEGRRFSIYVKEQEVSPKLPTIGDKPTAKEAPGGG
jgi:hypothetical protein